MFDISSLRIEVIDTNDSPPKFMRSTYSIVIREHSATGRVVQEVTATDADLVKF